jgi:hypothetical protein
VTDLTEPPVSAAPRFGQELRLCKRLVITFRPEGFTRNNSIPDSYQEANTRLIANTVFLPDWDAVLAELCCCNDRTKLET